MTLIKGPGVIAAGFVPPKRSSTLAGPPGPAINVVDLFRGIKYDDGASIFPDELRFARRPAPSVGLTAQEADAVLRRVTARWHRKIAVKAVDGFSDLPAPIQKYARK